MTLSNRFNSKTPQIPGGKMLLAIGHRPADLTPQCPKRSDTTFGAEEELFMPPNASWIAPSGLPYPLFWPALSKASKSRQSLGLVEIHGCTKDSPHQLTKLLDPIAAVFLLGPRQTGKTTLAFAQKQRRPNALYLDFELPSAHNGSLMTPKPSSWRTPTNLSSWMRCSAYQGPSASCVTSSISVAAWEQAAASFCYWIQLAAFFCSSPAGAWREASHKSN